MTIKCLGIDVSAYNITCHTLLEYPKGGLDAYWTKTRGHQFELYPKFYSYAPPNQKGKVSTAFDFIEYLKIEKPDVACLEPTGSHYSKLWYNLLKQHGVKVLWVGHIQLKRFRGGKNLTGHIKNDAVDSLALAAYYFDSEYCFEDGTPNPRYYLKKMSPVILELRDLVQQREHINVIQSPVINYTRQRQSWQFPEKMTADSVTFWDWLSDERTIGNASWLGRFDAAYAKSIAHQAGLPIDRCVRTHARLMKVIALEERELEKEIEETLLLEDFGFYNQIFDNFDLALKTRARLITRIFPFEDFLLPDGSEWKESENRVLKPKIRTFKDGKIFVETDPEGKARKKRIKRNRSRDKFKLRLGFGTILEQSGKGWTEVNHGSALCRKAIWQHVHCTIMKEIFPKSAVGEELKEHYYELASQPAIKGKHLEGKMMSKLVNLLYRECVRYLVF